MSGGLPLMVSYSGLQVAICLPKPRPWGRGSAVSTGDSSGYVVNRDSKWNYMRISLTARFVRCQSGGLLVAGMVERSSFDILPLQPGAKEEPALIRRRAGADIASAYSVFERGELCFVEGSC